MKTRPLVFVPLAMIIIGLPLACSFASDPAVRLAQCLESAINDAVPSTPSIEATCDVEQPGSYVVVLHPSGEVTDAQLVEAGIPEASIPELRALRISDNASIYVISNDATVKSSRTTVQNNFVKIDHLLAKAKSSQPLVVNIGGGATSRVIQAIH